MTSAAPRPRILMLNYEFPPLGGGGGAASLSLAKGFVRLGYEVDCVTTWFPGLAKREQFDGIAVYRVRVWGRKDRATATMRSLLSFPFAAYGTAAALCRKQRYAFMNTHFAVPTGPLGVLVSRRFGIRNVLSLHGGDLYDPTKALSPHRMPVFRFAVRFAIRNSDTVVAQSADTRENALSRYKPGREVLVIPLSYEPHPFVPASRESLGLAERALYAVSVGRLIPRKGLAFLLESIAAADDERFEALIIGEGPEEKPLKDLAARLGISRRVRFLGPVSEERKFQYLAASDVYVLSSAHEGFGIVLQEAMQAELPIIATDRGGQTDLVRDGETGILVPYGDVPALAGALRRALLSPERAPRASSRTLERFLPERIAEAYARAILP